MRILIVEDDYLVSLALKMFLTELGHIVVGSAVDARGAIQVLDDGVNADLAIIDLHLARGSSGIETAVQIRHLYGVASVFLTSDTDGARSARHAALGCLAKPISGLSLAAALLALEVLTQGRMPHDIPGELELFPVDPLISCLQPFQGAVCDRRVQS